MHRDVNGLTFRKTTWAASVKSTMHVTGEENATSSRFPGYSAEVTPVHARENVCKLVRTSAKFFCSPGCPINFQLAFWEFPIHPAHGACLRA
jgi:hypothetical protein